LSDLKLGLLLDKRRDLIMILPVKPLTDYLLLVLKSAVILSDVNATHDNFLGSIYMDRGARFSSYGEYEVYQLGSISFYSPFVKLVLDWS
jgi:hypothetical protein